MAKSAICQHWIINKDTFLHDSAYLLGGGLPDIGGYGIFSRFTVIAFTAAAWFSSAAIDVIRRQIV